MIIVDSSLHRFLGTILAFMHEDVSVQSESRLFQAIPNWPRWLSVHQSEIAIGYRMND
jgi:hypothetical protein